MVPNRTRTEKEKIKNSDNPIIYVQLNHSGNLGLYCLKRGLSRMYRIAWILSFRVFNVFDIALSFTRCPAASVAATFRSVFAGLQSAFAVPQSFRLGHVYLFDVLG